MIYILTTQEPKHFNYCHDFHTETEHDHATYEDLMECVALRREYDSLTRKAEPLNG